MHLRLWAIFLESVNKGLKLLGPGTVMKGLRFLDGAEFQLGISVPCLG